MSSEEEEERPPCIDLNDSRGSSVSSTIKNDYEELMKFVNIVPEKILTPVGKNVSKQAKLHSSSDFDDKENSSRVQDISSVESWLKNAHRGGETVENNRHDNSVIHLAGDMCLDGHQNQAFKLHPLKNKKFIDSSSMSDKRTVDSSSPKDISVKSMELSLDKWCLDLKSMVMDNFSTWRLTLLEQMKAEHEQTKHKFKHENGKYLDEIDCLKDEIQSLKRDLADKENTIDGLQTVVKKQNELLSKSKIMFKWKNELENVKREQMSLKMADIYRNRKLLAKAWASWHSLIENKWRERVEKACQLRAQEICQKLEEKYENQLEKMQQGLEESRMQIEAMQQEKLQYEENMRQAFLRGLSALNQEAHTIFHTPRSSQASMGPPAVQNMAYASCAPTEVHQPPALPAADSFGLVEAVGGVVDLTPPLAVHPGQPQFQTHQQAPAKPSAGHHRSLSPPNSAPVSSARGGGSHRQTNCSSAAAYQQPAFHAGHTPVNGNTPRNTDVGGGAHKTTSSAVGGTIGNRVRRSAIVEKHAQRSSSSNVVKTQFSPNLPHVKMKQPFRG